MLTLIPRDLWEHSIPDLMGGFGALLRSRAEGVTIDLPDLGHCIPVRSGRAGLVVALKALGLRERARVGVPLFCCPVVFSAVVAAGYTPRFVDVDAATFCISPEGFAARQSEIDAAVAVHLFGNACNMPRLQEISGGKPIIEDCAQALGTKRHERPVGMSGAFGVFSFRSGKYLSVGEGAALFCPSDATRSRVTALVQGLPAPDVFAETLHLGKCYLKSLLRTPPLYGLFGHALWHRRNKTRDEHPTAVASGQIYKSDLAIARRRLRQLPRAIERQREISDFYSRHLQLDGCTLCVEEPGAFYNRYHYPVTFPSKNERDQVADFLFRRGIDTMKYLDEVVSVARRHFGYAGDCPVAEHLAGRVLIIPNYHSLEQSEVEKIAECLNAAWAQTMRARKSALPGAIQPSRLTASVRA